MSMMSLMITTRVFSPPPSPISRDEIERGDESPENGKLEEVNGKIEEVNGKIEKVNGFF